MAGGGRIKGITLEINGDTTGLQQALKGVDSSLKNTQSQLRDVNKLLKMDPHNTELLRQKQELLAKAAEDTKEKLKTEREALKQLQAEGSTDPKAIEQQNALKREIIATEQELKNYQSQIKLLPVELQKVADVSGQVAEKTRGLSTAAAAVGAAMLGNAYNAAKSADDLNTLSKQTGFTVEELQKMQYASDLVDVSMDSMTGSVKKLTKNMSSESDVFDTLGVSIKDADGNMRDATDVWYDSLAALSKIQNETERDAVSMELFGKSAMDMAGIVDDGGAALKAAGDEAEDLGLILSSDTLQAANQFNDQMDKLKARTSAAFMEAGAALAEELVPALEKAVEAITKVLQWFSDLDGSTQAFILTVAGLVAAISPVAGIISAVAGAAAALNVAMLPMIATVGGIIVVLGALVAAGVYLYKNWDTIKKKAADLWKDLQTKFNNIANTIKTAINNAWTAVKTAFDNIKNYVSTAVNTVKTTVTNAFNTIKSTISSVLNSAASTVSSIFNGIKSTISSLMNGALSVVQSVINSIKGAFNFSVSLPAIGTAALDVARNAVSGVLGAIKGMFNFSWSLPSVATGAVDRLFGIVSGVANSIKGLFNFSWSLPTLKVPHVSVDGGAAPWGIGGRGRLPSFSVQWYKKAYDNGVLFTSPTVIPTASGMKGFGDGNGGELVIGVNRLKELVGAGSPTINVYAAPGMDEMAVANAVALKLDRWLGERI